MAQLTDDCFAAAGGLMPLEHALAALQSRLSPVTAAETVPIANACGRILAKDLTAGVDVPPHDNAAVDGYAIYIADLADDRETRLPVTGRAAAGHPLGRPAHRGEAIRIFTGAPMPSGNNDGPDTVMMQEDCRRDGDDVIILPGIRRGANRRARAEDVRSGTIILHAGDRLRPQDVGLAASVGCAELEMFAPLRVSVFSTGDEIRAPGASLPPGGVYDANRYCLMALLTGLGCNVTDLGILPDNPDTIRTALSAAATDQDAIVTSGGMSTGEEDHIAALVRDLGNLHFWRLAIKPGRPVGMGLIGRTPFIGLPGNPAAMMVTFLRLARPALLCLAGAAAHEPRMFRVRAAFDHRKKPNRREYVRVSLDTAPDGTLVAHKFEREGAGILSSLVESEGLVELAEDLTQVTAGRMVDFIPFAEVS